MKNQNQKNKPSPPRAFFSLDVEADGPAPMLGSMVSFALVDVSDLDKNFYAELAPICDTFVPAALSVSGFTREQTLKFSPAQDVMKNMQAWLSENYAGHRLSIWSDNPGFDWQFLNFYCHKFLGANPFGHSSRRIGDVSAGLSGNWRNDSGWKKMRTSSHTHNALDDALGNAGALQKLLRLGPGPKPHV